METELTNALDLKESFDKYCPAERNISAVQTGCDGKIYFLFSRSIPERIDGMFVNTIADTEYSVLVLTPDLYGPDGIISREYYPLGRHRMNFHFVQPFPGGDKLLLLGSRCMYCRASGGEKNAVTVDLHGNVLSEQCFGDGINDCIITDKGDIVTSFFDEGIFGNYGWDDPIGKSGLIVRDSSGAIKWEAPAERDIYDCYAVNVDDAGYLWYYYYDAFRLVRTDLAGETEYDPQISGADGFLISSDSRRFIFDGGYDKHGKFCYTEISGGTLTHPQPVHFLYGGEEPLMRTYLFRGSQAVFIDNRNRLFTYHFGNN